MKRPPRVCLNVRCAYGEVPRNSEAGEHTPPSMIDREGKRVHTACGRPHLGPHREYAKDVVWTEDLAEVTCGVCKRTRTYRKLTGQMEVRPHVRITKIHTAENKNGDLPRAKNFSGTSKAKSDSD